MTVDNLDDQYFFLSPSLNPTILIANHPFIYSTMGRKTHANLGATIPGDTTLIYDDLVPQKGPFSGWVTVLGLKTNILRERGELREDKGTSRPRILIFWFI